MTIPSPVLRRCSRCKEWKNPNLFWKNRKDPDGIDRRCAACENKRHAKRSRARQQALWNAISAYKALRGCAICGEDSPVCLAFHHSDPLLKVDGVSTLIAQVKSERIINEEVRKCHVLCANCHRKVHAGIVALSGETQCTDFQLNTIVSQVKLSPQAAKEIRLQFSRGLATKSELGRAFGVSHTSIKRIIAGEYWK